MFLFCNDDPVGGSRWEACGRWTWG